jgi:hypothetical protein
MSDHDKDADETPMQRALRMRKSAMAAKPKPPGSGKAPRADSGVAAGASKPASRK